MARHEPPYGPGVAIDDVDGLNAAIAKWIVERKSKRFGAARPIGPGSDG